MVTGYPADGEGVSTQLLDGIFALRSVGGPVAANVITHNLKTGCERFHLLPPHRVVGPD